LVHDYFQGYWVFWWHNKDMKSRHVLHAWAHSLCTIAHSKLLYLYGSWAFMKVGERKHVPLTRWWPKRKCQVQLQDPCLG
jgi:hypothetical protein